MTDLPPPRPAAPAIAPVAARRPHTATVHGVTIDDPWAWLKDAGYPKVEDKDVLAYLKAENDYYETVMAPLKPLADTLFTEMRGRIKEDESTVPQRDGDWIYRTDFET
ncbi:MAG TPA: S9 family peptidase, partial [Sphingomonas sp.]|nr:S9 family peptidase [Sphingomonas sp.]